VTGDALWRRSLRSRASSRSPVVGAAATMEEIEPVAVSALVGQLEGRSIRRAIWRSARKRFDYPVRSSALRDCGCRFAFRASSRACDARQLLNEAASATSACIRRRCRCHRRESAWEEVIEAREA